MAPSAVISLILVLLAAILRPTRDFFFLDPLRQVPTRPSISSRLPQIDAVRGLAIVAVMGIHAFYLAAISPGLATPEWVNAALVNNMMRFAVPVFLFFSGFCLSPWPSVFRDKLRFYARKLTRVFIPYILLSVLLSMHASGDLSLSTLGTWREGVVVSLTASPAAILAGLKSAALGSASVPFYFIVVLAQLYALYPLLFRVSRMPNPAPALLLGCSLVLSFVSAEIPHLRKIGEFHIFLPYMFTFVFGMLCRSLVQNRPLLVSMLKILATYVALNVACAAWVIVSGSRQFADGWYTYNFQYVYAITVAILGVNFFTRKSALCRTLAPMGKYSLWIFLLHFPLQEAVWHQIGCTTSKSAFPAAFGMWVVMTAAAWVLSALPFAVGSLSRSRRESAVRLPP